MQELLELLKTIGALTSKLKQGDYNLADCDLAPVQVLIEFCRTTGTKLSTLLAELELEVKFLLEVEEIKTKALSGPILTQRILKALPLVAIGLGILFGSDTLRVLLSPIGLICIFIGALFYAAGNKITKRHLLNFTNALDVDLLDHPIVILTIIKAGVMSGLSMLSILENLKISGFEQLNEGVPFRATNIPEYLYCLEGSYSKGESPIGPIDAEIYNLKSTLSNQSKKLGEELEVKLIIPLGTCYLPSFLFFGVIPTIVGMAQGL